MSGEQTVDEIVTNFLFSTCRLRQQLTRHAVQAAVHYAAAATLHPDDDKEAEFIPLTTGSVAEFYIEPMLPHVGDVDLMYHRSTQLAIPRGHPPPTQLPAEFSDYVKVFEIVDSHFPGYVYLVSRYLLTECTDDGMYRYMGFLTLAINCAYHLPTRKVFTDQHWSKIARPFCPLTMYPAYDVCRGRHKPLIGQHVRDTTAGQTQQLLIVLSATDVMWFAWHIVNADKMNGRATFSGDCHSHEQRLSC